jgi:16S rRNA (cytosine967-C5)-methyltransferase
MTPPARLSAAIEILDRVLAGMAAEKALTGWARGSRYAGSKDRAAVRDLVFGALRCLRSQAALGGAMTGRGVILGGLRASGADPGAVFTGEGHAPPPLAPDEIAAGHPPAGFVALDCPDWIAPALRDSLGADFQAVMTCLQSRAPVHLRVNLAKTSRESAMARLAGEAIIARPHPLSPTALEVTDGARRVQLSGAFADGWVELQDAASQAVTDALPLRLGLKVLDYCAGGGGKVLAMAGRVAARYYAYDAAPARMRDLPGRAARAGAEVTMLDAPDAAAPYDLVLCDVPCSGSGAWRRAPESKWRLDADRLARLCALQAEILEAAAALVAPGGTLAYATCSLLACENEAQIAGFCRRWAGWEIARSRSFTPLDGGDGFFTGHLTKHI